MNLSGGIPLQNGGAPAMAEITVAQPLNDVQLVALIASHCLDSMTTPKEAVAKAVEIMAEAVFQAGGDKLGKKVKALDKG